MEESEGDGKGFHSRDVKCLLIDMFQERETPFDRLETMVDDAIMRG